jgi:hypothetical protein
MSSEEEASRVFQELGDQERGSAVMIKISHGGKKVPTIH